MAYPTDLPSFAAATDDVTDSTAALYNTQNAVIVAVATELGTDPAGSLTDVKSRLAVCLAADGTLEFADSTVLTISGGAVTVTQNFHRIATEGGAGSDYLATINGLANDGAILFIRPSSANDIILDTGAGNITCRDGADITLADTDDIAVLVYDANLTTWVAGVFAGGGVLTTSAGAADSYVAVYTAAGNIEGTDDLQWNGTTFTIGDGTADRDYILTFNGETTDGVITWMEDEDYFKIGDDILMDTAEKIQLRDTAIGIYSQADTYLDMFADGGVRIGDSSAGAPTNYAAFAADGELTLAGTARVEKSYNVSFSSLGVSPSSAPTPTNIGNYKGYAYAIGDDSYLTMHMPHDWAAGTDISVHIYWYINEAYATASGEIQWQCLWSSCAAGEAVDAPTHTGTLDFGDQNIPTTAKWIASSEATIAGANFAAEDTVGMQLSRVILDGGTNPTAEPVIIDVHIDYIADKLGEAT